MAENINDQEMTEGEMLKKVILPVIFVAIGVAALILFYKFTNQTPRKPRIPSAPLVELKRLKAEKLQVVVPALGSVEPSREIVLQPRVSGEVIYVSEKFILGGVFKGGEVILRIDRKDYEIARTQRMAEVAQAESNYKIELGKQESAKRELELVGGADKIGKLDRELVLRIPQLKQAKAALESARAALAKAELDLARTEVKSPFNAIVRSRNADLGSQVSAQSSISTLVGYDSYWVRVSVPLGRLKWVDIPSQDKGTASKASPVKITMVGTEGGLSWKGRVIRRLPDLESRGRMAQLLIEVDNPLGGEGGKALLIGSYVNADIYGAWVENAFDIPRVAVREGDQIWIMNPQNKLEIRDVDFIWKERERVYLGGGVKDGEMLVVNNISVPVEGMELRVSTNDGQQKTSQVKQLAQPAQAVQAAKQ